ncbi:MAG TPA: NAD(P)/FAD-dependent oxidoreductase, partial [Nocardioidaceae bacterium]|nr:NAD(P)/FAD-dependent oxidoreductase [Nocardioidaceae bacterium]
ETNGETVQLTCGWLWNCAGYYDYSRGYRPGFPGQADFAGQIVDPQFWPEDLDYEGRKVVVIGSGATAVTLVPAMAGVAEHVTMLQRSPTYVLSLPLRDVFALTLRKFLPTRTAYFLARWKNIFLYMGIYKVSKWRPAVMKRIVRHGVAKALPEGFDIDTHFTPTYDPWDERLCFVPDNDLFLAIGSGDASVVTDTIDTFTEKGIRLASGIELEADIVVTATGLVVQPFGGAALTVDGEAVSLPEKLAYKAMMLSEVPNFAFTIGYTNISWTLKADLTSDYVCRVLDHMKRKGYTKAVAVSDPNVGRKPFMDLKSGYVLRALDIAPKQGTEEPWMLKQSYVHDLRRIRRADIEDGVLAFT